MRARWIFPEFDPAAVEHLARELGFGLPAARVLWTRGHRTADAARRFLATSIDDLHDPALLHDMERAAARLHRAIERREKILLYGDYDVDGTTSVVILRKAIELAGGQADYHVPHRIREGYGMRPEVIDRAAADGVSLIVSVDTGIRAGAVVEHATSLGIDVIVTDHHLPEQALPPALAVLNPNRPDCDYPDKNLCGAGVAFKLVQALFARLGWDEAKRRRMLESFLKLVAVATVADVVPLTGENRIIVKQGLCGFRQVRNRGLRALLEVSGFSDGECPSAGQVAFRIAPRINAAGRMDTASDVIRMFLAEDDATARELAGKLHALNHDRQQTEADMVKTILGECEREPVTDARAGLVFAGEGWHRGVAGIVASRLVDRFHRPSIVLGIEAETGLAHGSGRGIPAFHLLDALESMKDLFERFGGHRQAAGVTLRAERVAEFRSRFEAFAASCLTPEDFRPQVELDAPIALDEIRDRTVAQVLSLAPFGFGNPAPVFGAMGVRVAGPPEVLKQRHLRVRLQQNGRTIVAKAWNFAARAAEFEPGREVDVAICLEEDAWAAKQGFPPWGVVLREVRAAVREYTPPALATSGML